MVVKVSPAEPLWNRYLFGNTVKNHMLISALKYYLLSIPTVLLGLNFWKIPFLTWEKHILLRTNKGFKFYVGNLMDTWTIKEVVLDNCYKYDSKPKDVIIDIGAGIGDFSIYASDVSTLVYAVEIERERLNLLRKNIHLNDRRNIKIVARKLNSLDEFFKKQKVKRCDFLKVDCEGCEYDLLLSTSNQVLTKISAISCEIHLFDEEHFRLYKKLRNKLERSGFTVDDVNNPVYTCLHFLYAIRVN